MRRAVYKLYATSVQPLLPNVVDEIIQMTVRLRYFPNLWNPRTFNEQIGHRKLFTNDQRFAQLSDKWRVREYVRTRIGEDYLIPVYDHVTSISDVVLHKLPKAFVVKGTHDSGSSLFVEDKESIDWNNTLKELGEVLATTFGKSTNEYWYRDIPPGLIFEERLIDQTYNVPLDFKCLVFHGRVKVIQVMARADSVSQRFYDRSWTPLQVRRPGTKTANVIPRPRQLEHMIEVAETLGKGFDFVRVDLYAPNDERVLFGEMTFSPAAGRRPFIPRSFDWELGRYWMGS